MYQIAITLADKLVSKTVPNTRDNCKHFYSLIAKLFLLDYCVWIALFTDPEHLYWKEESHESWQKVRENLEVVTLGEDIQVIRDYKAIASQFKILVSGMSKGSTHASGFTKSIVNFSSMGYYGVAKRDKELQAQFFLANPDLEAAKSVWGMADSGFILGCVEMILPSVKVNKLIQIPRHREVLTLENIDNPPVLE